MRDWGKESEYLHSTRRHLWNNDYFEFLVKCVWKIDKPVKIIDFGCGYGYLAQLFLSIIPKGSTYKGIDISEQLIEMQKKSFMTIQRWLVSRWLILMLTNQLQNMM